jgi:multidrug resistance efflux pump
MSENSSVNSEPVGIGVNAPPQGQAQAPAKARRNIFSIFKNPVVILALLVLVAGGGYFGYRYWLDLQTRIYIENAQITAPIISVGPEVPGILKDLYVKAGDDIAEGQQLFLVGSLATNALTSGIVTAVQNTPGQMVSSASPIVQMYDPSQLRLVGQLQEDQGLADVRVGQNVIFTVDAYGSRQYSGIVERIGDVADTGSIVFSISDKRQEKMFDVTVAFDVSAYPELKNGMSAKMWIYK